MFMIREYYNSLIKKWSDYLVIPNSLLLFNAPSLTILLNTSSYARDTARPTQTKGSTESSPCSTFYVLLPLRQKQNKTEFIHQNYS